MQVMLQLGQGGAATPGWLQHTLDTAATAAVDCSVSQAAAAALADCSCRYCCIACSSQRLASATTGRLAPALVTTYWAELSLLRARSRYLFI